MGMHVHMKPAWPLFQWFHGNSHGYETFLFYSVGGRFEAPSLPPLWGERDGGADFFMPGLLVNPIRHGNVIYIYNDPIYIYMMMIIMMDPTYGIIMMIMIIMNL